MQQVLSTVTGSYEQLRCNGHWQLLTVTGTATALALPARPPKRTMHVKLAQVSG